LKDVPTIAEAGYPKLAAEDWAGLLLKAGTPPTVIAQLNEAINKALKTDKVREALAKIGTDPGGGTPEAFGYARTQRDGALDQGRQGSRHQDQSMTAFDFRVT
jgi:tripartite-type tricarboxylate transporter receptor subunit TctC